MDESTPPSGSSREKAEQVAAKADQLATTSRAARDSSSVSTAKRLQLQSQRSASANSSPLPSRESSPVRPTLKSTARTTGPGRSRKNSVNDVSPSRSASTNNNPPSAAAQLRALSAATTPALYPTTSDSSTNGLVLQKPSVTSDLKDSPRWPISPRLRSPPPVTKPAITSPRKSEQDLPSINVQKPPAKPSEQDGKQPAADGEVDDSQSLGMRTPARGVSGASSTLETVQEISQPNTPSFGVGTGGAVERAENDAPKKLFDSEHSIDGAFSQSIKAKTNNESGSESGGKGEIKLKTTPAGPATTLRPSGPATKSYSTTTAAGRGKPSGEGSTRNMTVETETVSSIPQIAVGGTGGQGNNGSIRAKPSSETIRPKKEKKKITRKTPSVTSGTGEQLYLSRPRLHHHHHHHHPSRNDISDASCARSPEMRYSQGLYSLYDSSSAISPERPCSQASRTPSLNLYNVGTMLTRVRPASSKADIFEAKVASAVDEANSSDSEETFVYESNPPDANDRPRRFHSRTPSATSMASQLDQRNGSRSIMDGVHSVAMKKSMKFANSFNTNTPETTTGEDDGKGTARSSMGTGRGTTHHHHHIGRWGRNGGNGHPSLFDNESPFPNATKSRISGSHSPRLSSHPTSPRVGNVRAAGNGRKPPTIPYDMDDAADDERTPLMSSIRSNRSGRVRRPASSSMRQLEHQALRQNRSFCARFAGCLVLSFMIFLVILASVGFMLATTQPLANVKILALKNVLASEQDLILDMKVQGRNPNVVVLTIDSTDLVLFAKSKYAGTNSEWWRHPPLRSGIGRRDDDPLDPPIDGSDPGTNPNLEIGHVYDLDTSLTFEGSPFHRSFSTSVGQIRINHPGNTTVPAGSERWGRVIQHEFDLIVRGTLKYSLPLSQKLRSISVEGRVTVKPNAADLEHDDTHITSD